MTIEDEKVQFYLRHRDQLEEWCALRSEAAAAVDEWLTGLRPDVESLAAELGPDVELVAALDDSGWPSLNLKRSAWPGTTEAEAIVVVGLQWAKGKTVLGASSAPYVGVRSDKTTSIGRALREDEQFQRIRRERRDKSTAWWPAYNTVRPEGLFPQQAEGYRLALIKSINDAWNAYASAVDTVAVKV